MTATKAQLAYRAQRFNVREPSPEEELRLLIKEGSDAIERQKAENIRIAALVGLSWCEVCADWTPKVHEHYRPSLRKDEYEKTPQEWRAADLLKKYETDGREDE